VLGLPAAAKATALVEARVGVRAIPVRAGVGTVVRTRLFHRLCRHPIPVGVSLEVAERRLAVQHVFGELPSEPGVEAAQPRSCGPVAAGRDQMRNLLNLAGADVPSGGERIGQTSQQRAPVRVRLGSDGFDVDALKGVNRLVACRL